MHSNDAKVTKVWWSKKFVLKWRFDYMSRWRVADVFDTLQEADDARQNFIKANR